MLRSVGPVLLLLLLLLAMTSAQQPDCDIGQPQGLSDCIKGVLEGLRDDVRKDSDPLRLPGSTKQDGRVTTTVSEILIYGLSAYNIGNLDVTFPEGSTRINVKTTIGWPELSGNVHARAKAERRIFRKKVRASASADVEVRVSRPVGNLDVTIEIDVHPNGTIAARPVSTDVSVALGDIDVKVRIGGLGGVVNRLIGDPVSRITSVVAEQLWKREWRPKAEREAKEALEKAIVEKLGVQLSELLHN